MKKFAADRIYPVSSAPIEDGVVVVDNEGKVLAVDRLSAHDPATVQKFSGAIVPGFVNAHCHLELSHMKGVAPTGTGLLPFLKTVVDYRDVSEEQIQKAIEEADREMWENGIQAVGDICNKADTAATKSKSRIRYYSFVEMFDFLQDDWAQKTFDAYYEVFKQQPGTGRHRKSCVPHAPYSVSKTLFGLIHVANDSSEVLTVSIHNQETEHEDNFFLRKTGDLCTFFKDFGIDIRAFQPTGQPSIYYAMDHMDARHRSLFVHNTRTQPEEIAAAVAWSKGGCYWATCPNANLYIENRLPHYRYFMDAGAHVCIGTDSLTSNWQLSVLEEMKTIARFQSYLSFDTLLQWATLNGARALGFEDELGSIAPGKRPGLLLLNLKKNWELAPSTEVKRLV